jgi:RHS repeat-associated protein
MLFVDYESEDADPASGQRYYLFCDQRGCPERLVDDAGETVWEAYVEPYGTAHVLKGHDFYQPLRFPGHWWDAELGLHYNRFRYYSPWLGRYVQVDPIAEGGGWNVYGYSSRSLTRVDVRGLDDCGPNADTDDASRRRAGDRGDDGRRGSAQTSADLLADPSRRPDVRVDGTRRRVRITHGDRAGEEITVINGHHAGTTLNGVPRDANGFPEFNSRYDTVLGDEHLGTGDHDGHIRESNRRLGSELREDPSLQDRLGLTDEQAGHLTREPPSSDPPPDMTWHHHQDTGRMQLVDREEHQRGCPHTGGMSIWGGGYR